MDNPKDSLAATTSTPDKPLPVLAPSTPSQERSRSITQDVSSEGEHNFSTFDEAKSIGMPERPRILTRRSTTQTQYVDMLLHLDKIPMFHNILAAFFTWVLLAGYIVFPVTFNKIGKGNTESSNSTAAHALATIRNVHWLYVAAVACGVGVLGCLWLWWKYRKNYVWVINRLFVPAFMNSIAGLLSTLANIYSAQDGTSLPLRATEL